MFVSFFPLAGISFQKTPETQAKERSLNMHLEASNRDEGFSVLGLNKVLIM